MNGKWALAVALASRLLVACGDGDRLPVEASRPAGPHGENVDQPTPGMGQPGAEAPEMAGANGDRPSAAEPSGPAQPQAAQTELAPAEAPLGGETSVATSGRYTMISRVAAPISSAAAGDAKGFQLLTGVIALQGSE